MNKMAFYIVEIVYQPPANNACPMILALISFFVSALRLNMIPAITNADPRPSLILDSCSGFSSRIYDRLINAHAPINNKLADIIALFPLSN